MTPTRNGKRRGAVVCPGCGGHLWESRLASVLDDSGAISSVYRILQGRRGHAGVRGGGACADWVASYSTLPDAPERMQPTLRALGRRILRNLLDLGWVDEAEVRKLVGLDVAVEAEVARRQSDDARARMSLGYAMPSPPPSRIPVQREEPRTADLSRFTRRP
jgi:hypothetical protein